MNQRMSSSKSSDSYTPGYAVFILALTVGLLINVSANIIYERFLRASIYAQDVVLVLTGLCFVGLIYGYHTRLHTPLVKFLQEFE